MSTMCLSVVTADHSTIEIPLKEVKSEVLRKVVEYLEHHTGARAADEPLVCSLLERMHVYVH